MAVIKEIAEQEKARLQAGIRNELHLYRHGHYLQGMTKYVLNPGR